VPNKYVQIDGVATFIHHTGPSTLPDEPPRLDQGEVVLCLHGAGGNGNLFSELFDALSETHSLVAFDQPGHGRSGGLDSLGAIDAMADFTLALIAKLGLESPVLLGHDMGAAVALESAIRSPERVGGLILCAAGDRFDFPDSTLAQAERVRDGKERRPFDPAVFAPETTPEIMKKAFMEGLKTDPRATFGDLTACRDWNPGQGLAEIKCPARIFHGDGEIDWVKERASALAHTLPAGELEIVSAAGHALLLEAPKALGDRVGTFLEQIAA
jgi:pimeloyl-ACP methyl ester carboxylesterase